VGELTIEASDGVRIWAAETGSRSAGERLPMVFLHGFTGSSSATGHLAEVVVASGRCFITPDLRGHGLSGKPAGQEAYSLRRFAEDVLDTASAFGLGHFHLAGHCMGGMVAAAVALQAPERLASLSLIGTSLRPSAERPFFTRLTDALVRPIGPLARRVFPEDTAAEPHVDYSRFGRMTDTYLPRLVADWRALTWDTGEKVLRTIRTIDLLDAARAVRVPTLVVHGGRDTIFPAAAAERTQSAIRGSDLLMLPRDNHVTLVLDPASALFGGLVSFADRIDGPA
jgi:pimeloyl-ACP methyl ester carboxylesterase